VALFYLNGNTIAARNTQAFRYFCAPPLYNGFGFLATDKGPPTTDILDALATNRIHPEGRLPRPVGLGGAAGADLATRGADSAVHLGRTGPVPGNRGGAEIARRLSGSRPADRLHPLSDPGKPTSGLFRPVAWIDVGHLSHPQSRNG